MDIINRKVAEGAVATRCQASRGVFVAERTLEGIFDFFGNRA